MKHDDEQARGYEVQVSVALVFNGEIVRCVGQVLSGSESDTLRSFRAFVHAMNATLRELQESSGGSARINGSGRIT